MEILNCKTCSKSFNCRFALNLHLVLFHPEVENMIEWNLPIKKEEKSCQTDQNLIHLFDTNLLDQDGQLKFQRVFTTGQERIHVYLAEHPKKNFFRAKNSTIKKVFKEKPWKCQFCWKSFFEEENKNVHERFHADDRKPFRCQFCLKKFVFIKNRKKHERIKHESIRQPNLVSICD